jgi:hypothetical protein
MLAIKQWPPFSERRDRVKIGSHDLSFKLGQILGDQLTPANPVHSHQQPAFRKLTKVDWREAKIFCERAEFPSGSVIVAR